MRDGQRWFRPLGLRLVLLGSHRYARALRPGPGPARTPGSTDPPKLRSPLWDHGAGHKREGHRALTYWN